jgi:hypothetical protein
MDSGPTSTCLNEQGWHPDLIELQPAHSERDEVRGAYNRVRNPAMTDS